MKDASELFHPFVGKRRYELAMFPQRSSFLRNGHGTTAPVARTGGIFLSCLLSTMLPDSARAETIFLGPTPYLSAADSPFDLSGLGTNFFLEDFEDGELNTPGIFEPLHHVLGTRWHGEVLGPGEFTDSVDADDGSVDGSGTAGHSFRSGGWLYSQTGIQRNQVHFEFEFDATKLGYLPNAFGFVWTDGPRGIDFFRPGLRLGMTIIDSEGNRLHSPAANITRSVNLERGGQTLEDVFLGVISDFPIKKVSFSGVYYGDLETMRYLEIDHVQFGWLVVPEPGTCSLLVSLFSMLLTWKVVGACRAIGVLKRICNLWTSVFLGAPAFAGRSDRIALGMRVIAQAALLVPLLVTASAQARPGDLLFMLHAPEPQPGAEFGEHVLGVGEDILVSEQSRLLPDIGIAGRAYLFGGNSGQLKTVLENPEPEHEDGFGQSIACNDSFLAVSTNRGQEVYVFDRSGSSLVRELTDPMPDPGFQGINRNSFGTSIAAVGDNLLITAPSADVGSAANAGRAYLMDPRTGEAILQVDNPQPDLNDILGSAATQAAFGSDLVVSAHLDDVGPGNDDSGRVFVIDGDTGAVRLEIENPNPGGAHGFGDWFGFSVATTDESIIVGARKEDLGEVEDAGAVYAYDGVSGELLLEIPNPEPEENAFFGRSVAAVGGDILVGAWGASVEGVPRAGKVYLFDGQSGALKLSIANPTPLMDELFGWSVSAVGNSIVVGSRVDHVGVVPAAGAVYVFQGVPEPSTCISAVLQASVALVFLAVRR